jgi:DNA-directed RNA polymerase alpha subunit
MDFMNIMDERISVFIKLRLDKKCKMINVKFEESNPDVEIDYNPLQFEKCFLNDLDLSQICQESLKVCNIIDIMKLKLLMEAA